MNTEQDIIYNVLQKFRESASITARWYASAEQKNLDGKIAFKIEKEQIELPIIVKKELKNIHLIQVKNLRTLFNDLVVIAEIIAPGLRKQMKEMGIKYMDGAGNCYLNIKNSLIYIEGFKTPVVVNPEKKANPFTKTGLILVFHFLIDEDFLNTTYRQIAALYDIALGNVNNVIASLKANDFLVQRPDATLKLIRREELIQEWIAAYASKLKPDLLVGSFRFLNGNDFTNWEKLPLKNNETQWGGEPAGDLLTNYLKPARLTLYTQEAKSDLIKRYKLVPEEKGNLEVYRKFWRHKGNNENFVPPLLAYADLVNSNDPRNLETAHKLYEQHIKNQL